MDDYNIPNGNRQRPDDVIWRDFDEECRGIKDEDIRRVASKKGNYRYLKTDGLFNQVIEKKDKDKK